MKPKYQAKIDKIFRDAHIKTAEYQAKIDKINRDACIKAAQIEADAELKDSDQRGKLGFCHLFWATQKRILRDKYKIDWKTPAEKNKGVIIYD